jgi:hypothetical protein
MRYSAAAWAVGVIVGFGKGAKETLAGRLIVGLLHVFIDDRGRAKALRVAPVLRREFLGGADGRSQ